MQWFDTHRCDKELDLGHGLVVRDIKKLTDQSRNIVLHKYDSPTYSGQIQLLFHLQDEMIKQGLVSD